MRVLLDSSVLVAASIAGHPDHSRSRAWVERSHRGEIDLVLATHSLVETYSVLTRFPVRPRISPASAHRLIRENLLPFASLVALTAREVVAHLAGLAEQEVAGGAVYDALITRAAEKGAVDRIVTLDVEDFRRVAPGIADRIELP